ncbi:hypothetical protein KIN20_013888 [Parelaphostrongylus tenuis]|uniref:Uncharacterized protein n=1 Tax=Parelaphostrongylus tenuis TaxID=148309 RepID=A0AAD5QP17_PARTN|nr:hypothetical protein KIN20_013888 [Parelaphostrongylus tenuis]
MDVVRIGTTNSIHAAICYNKSYRNTVTAIYLDGPPLHRNQNANVSKPYHQCLWEHLIPYILATWFREMRLTASKECNCTNFFGQTLDTLIDCYPKCSTKIQLLYRFHTETMVKGVGQDNLLWSKLFTSQLQ